MGRPLCLAATHPAGRQWAAVLLRLACVLAALAGPAVSALAAAALADADVRGALAQGRPQAVIVQLVDRPAATESQGQKRTRRDGAKLRVQRALDSAHFERRHDYTELPMLALTLRHPDALARLLAHADVAVVFADRPIKLYTDPALTLVNQPPVASVMQRTGAGQTIAVLDTGVDHTQPAMGSCSAPNTGLGCKVVASYYTSTQSSAPPGSTLDGNGHGTDVASVALMVAPGARIASVGVFGANGSALSSDVIAGVNWAIANRSAYNIVAINMSLGDGVNHDASRPCNMNTSAFHAPVRNARNAGIVVVASAGNEGYTTGIAEPACLADAVAVGAVYSANWGGVGWGSGCSDATTAADQVACFSNSGAQLDALAPGALFRIANRNLGGTSFAAPVVAAAVAVLKAQFPGEAPAAIEARILNSGPSITDPRNGLARRRLDLLAAQGAPGNDLFSARTVASGNAVSATGWNYNASLETAEPTILGLPGGHSVWWRWTPALSGRLQISSAGSAFDTLLAVYTGNTVGGLVQRAANDDDGDGVGGTSSVALDVTAGTAYAIQVDGKGGARGAVNLSLNWALPSADLAVSLDGQGTAFTAGQSLVLTALVTNAGPSPATSTVVRFTLPPPLQYVSGPTGCSANGQIVTCALGTVAVGSVTLAISVSAVAPGVVTVPVNVTSAVADPNLANNTSEPSAGDIPTLPEWGAILLALSLLALGARRPA